MGTILLGIADLISYFQLSLAVAERIKEQLVIFPRHSRIFNYSFPRFR